MQPDWGTLAMGLAGGLALFLYGMERMGESLKAIAGARMRAVLSALSHNRLVGMLTGIVVTGVIQSSSVTTVMLVGFVSAGLMSLSQTIGVILGAKIGTTVTAQLVAFKVTKMAYLLVAGGFAAWFLSGRARVRLYGTLVMGLGLVFLGMNVMSESMKPLRELPAFIDLMAHLSNPIAGIAVAAVFTALVQSSSATMGVIIALSMQGLIGLEAGIALALGANIGTCATAGLSAIGKPREAVRVAAAHVLFSVGGVLLISPFLEPFAALVRSVSSEEIPRQIANAHTLFNVGLAAVFLPSGTLVVRLVERLVPDRPLSETATHQLDPLLLRTSGLALPASRREIGRLGALVREQLAQGFHAAMSGTEEDLAALEKADEAVDALYGAIITFLGQLSQRDLSQEATQALLSQMSIANELESIGDVVETDLVALGRRRLQTGVTVSPATRSLLTRLHNQALDALDVAIEAAREVRPDRAREVIERKDALTALVERVEAHQVERLTADEPGRLEAYSFEIDVTDKLRRCYYHSKRVAKAVASSA